MRRELIEVTIPEPLDEGFDLIPATGLYESVAEFVSEAMRTLWVARKDLRMEIACRLYAQGEISIGRACKIAEVDIESFKKVLACNESYFLVDIQVTEIIRELKEKDQ